MCARLPDGGMVVKDSKHPDGPVLLFPASQWRAFTEGVKLSDFMSSEGASPTMSRPSSQTDEGGLCRCPTTVATRRSPISQRDSLAESAHPGRCWRLERPGYIPSLKTHHRGAAL